jgi:DHA1 family bicyclomycin/chloramphenicol resistance-like MFS transporter
MDDTSARKLHEQAARGQAASAGMRTPWGLLMLLMAMTAIGPTSLNIIVPAVPRLAAALATDSAAVQLTVSLYLVGLATAQLVVGPLADRFGRRPVALAGLALTALASLMAIAAASVTSLILARILQAVGAAAGIVVSRAIIRDLFDKDRAASTLGLVATVMAVAPTIGPLIGGALDTAFGWESIFVFMVCVGLAVLGWAATTLPETRGLNVHPGEATGLRFDLGALAASASFWGYILAAALGSATFFAFLGGGPYVVVNILGHTSAEYGVWFALSSIGYIAGNFTASRLALRYGTDALIWWGIAIELVGVAASVAMTAWAPHWGPIIVFLPQAVISFGNGVLLPNAIAGAVSVRPQAAGAAAGIVGFAQMALGAATTQFAGYTLAQASSALPLSIIMSVIAVACAVAFGALVTVRRGPQSS